MIENNEQSYSIEKLKEVLKEAKSIAIVPSEIAGADSFSAAAGLYHTLKAIVGKEISLVYVATIPEGAKGLVEPEDLTGDIFSRKLSISIDYSDTPASKLSYSNEESVLKLVLSPVSKDFDRSKIRTKVEGYNFDLIMVLGVQTPEDLGVVYKELREDFSNATIINLDNTGLNLNHGSINIIDKSASNLSELVFKLLSKVGLVPNGKAAKALLVGMTYRELKN